MPATMPPWILEPPLALAVIYVIAGLYGLAKGGDWLVDGAVAVARRFNLAPAVIGATVVAFGTSAPELVVSLSAAGDALAQADGAAIDPDGPIAISIANVVGSNIANIGLILGIALLVAPATIPRHTLRLDIPAVILATLAFACCIWPFGGPPGISRVEAVLLFASLFVYIIWAIRSGAGDSPEGDVATRPWLAIIGGLGLLLVGGRICLAGAVSIAEAAGMSERVIGLTIVAAGTSLPELFASIQAARKGFSDIAIANVIGSNIFNILCILGITGMLVPLPVNQGTLGFDLWWMVGFLVIILPGMYVRKRLGAKHGMVLLGGYVVYTSMLLLS